MTGTAPINSPFASQTLKDLYIEEYLQPKDDKKVPINIKNSWHHLAIAKAGLEISHSEKMASKDIHTIMVSKFKAWASLMVDESDASIKTNSKPTYLDDLFFGTTDKKTKKRYRIMKQQGRGCGRSGVLSRVQF